MTAGEPRWTVASALLTAAAVATLLAVAAPGTHLPTGDGAHLLAAGWRIGASSAPLDDLLHRITPHPPLAYVVSALFTPLVGVRPTLAVQSLLAAVALLVGLRWLRPDSTSADIWAGAGLLVASGAVWWSTDQFALDWPAAALGVLALGAVVRALDGPPPARAPVAAMGVASCILAALFTKYTAAFSLAGGLGMALALGGWRRPVTWWTAGGVALMCGLWGVWALDDLSAYSSTTLASAGAGGPAGSINQDPDLDFATRLSVSRLRLWGLALRDTVGWAPLVAVLAAIGVFRASSLGRRVALGAAMVPLLVLPLTRVQPQPRYLLPVAVFLVAAALPGASHRYRQGFTAFIAILTAITLYFSASLYRGLPIADRPGHRSAVPTAGPGDWPWPAAPLWPTRARVESRGTVEALVALDAQLEPGQSAALVRFDTDPNRPSWAAIDLTARTAGIQREWVVAESPRTALTTPPGMQAPSWAWVAWTDQSAGPALAWVQNHANLEGAVTWWEQDGTGGVVLPLGHHEH